MTSRFDPPKHNAERAMIESATRMTTNNAEALRAAALSLLMGARPAVRRTGEEPSSLVPNWRIKALADALASQPQAAGAGGDAVLALREADTVTDAHRAVAVLNGMRGGGNMARAVLRLCALAATPAPAVEDEPDAWLHSVTQGDDGQTDLALSFAPDNFPLSGELGFRSLGAVPLYTHPPIRQDYAVATQLTRCCGREECGGECGNEWRGMEWVRKDTTPPAEAREPDAPADEAGQESAAAEPDRSGEAYHGGSGRAYATLAEAQQAGETSIIGPITFIDRAPIGIRLSTPRPDEGKTEPQA